MSHHVKNLSDLRDFVKTFPTRRQLWINAGKQTVVPGRLIPLLNLRDFFIDVILYNSPVHLDRCDGHVTDSGNTIVQHDLPTMTCLTSFLPDSRTFASDAFFMLPPGSHMTILYQLVGSVAILTCAQVLHRPFPYPLQNSQSSSNLGSRSFCDMIRFGHRRLS